MKMRKLLPSVTAKRKNASSLKANSAENSSKWMTEQPSFVISQSNQKTQKKATMKLPFKHFPPAAPSLGAAFFYHHSSKGENSHHKLKKTKKCIFFAFSLTN